MLRRYAAIRRESARVSDPHGGWIRVRAVDEAGPSRLSFIGLASWNAARVPSGWEWLHRLLRNLRSRRGESHSHAYTLCFSTVKSDRWTPTSSPRNAEDQQ